MANDIPLASIERIIRNSSPSVDRVSAGATQFMAEEVVKYITNLTNAAIKYTNHAHRKTLNEDDIKAALGN